MKAQKPLWKISITTTFEAEDAVAEMLGGIFQCIASSFFDCEKKTNRVVVFVSNKVSQQGHENLRQSLKYIKKCGLDIGSGKISIAKIRHEDWAESWKRHFKLLEIGNTLLVKPSWIKKRPRMGQAVVILDPGLSFGTGQHPTTLYCLQKIVKNSKWNQMETRGHDRFARQQLSFLDIGTGSGILAIAAVKLGYKPVYAMDFDPEAVRTAQGNARVNGVKIRVDRADVTKLSLKPKRRFNLICANLISSLLIEQQRHIMAQLDSTGILVLAGILKSEFNEVQRVFEKAGMKLMVAKSEKEWRSGAFCFA